MQLKEIYTPEVVCCARETTALGAAVLMRQRHVGAVVVVNDINKDRTPIGVITDRDLAVEVMATGLEAQQTQIVTLTRKPVVIAHENEELNAVIERMRNHGIRRMPVVDQEGALVGIVTLDDLLVLMVENANALVQITSKEQHQERHTRR